MRRTRLWSKHGKPPHTTPGPNVLKKNYWHYKRIVYYAVVPRNKTINAEVNCEQLSKLNEDLLQDRPELIDRKNMVFHRDNARHHISFLSRQKLLELEWTVLSHPPYSSEITPSDHYVLRCPQCKFIYAKLFCCKRPKNFIRGE